MFEMCETFEAQERQTIQTFQALSFKADPVRQLALHQYSAGLVDKLKVFSAY